ncbi:MAG: colicin V production family protein [Alphaproteobacteria bacterium CG_4_9_14_3_um_filter_47_13]|nr:MAG: colicin V production family protein [Alphaproteobacteria bacterium CG_4_9_14_3_um_filter_47_13]
MIFDIVVLATLLISAIIAFLRGFIREILTIFGVAGGLAAAWSGGALLFPIVRGWFGSEEADDPGKIFGIISYDIAATIIAYGSIFIIVVIVLSIASHFLAGWVKSIGLGAVDRTMGVIFGFLRGILILGFLYLPVHVMIDIKTQDEWFKGSKTRFYVVGTAEAMMAMLPESFKEDMTKKTAETTESLTQSTREKLQELDMLGDRKKATPPSDERAGPDNKNSGEMPEDGYQKNQRQDMNELFEGQYND